MSKKIGRNDPCPCGSGKKYKNCCGRKEILDFFEKTEIHTGKEIDDYVSLLKLVGIWAQKIMQFDEDGKELVLAKKKFEYLYKPGTEEGVSNGLYLGWLYFDFRFGKSRKTVCERLLEAEEISKLNEPGPTHLRHLSKSYCTFYEVKAILDDWIILEELGTGKEWRYCRTDEPFESNTTKGEIWYIRLVGTPEKCFNYMDPYIYKPESKQELLKIINYQKNQFLKSLKENLPEETIFIESCRAAVVDWAHFILKGIQIETKKEYSNYPILQNTDGEIIKFSEIFFKIKELTGLKEKISSIDIFNYDENNRWIWTKKTSIKGKMFSPVILGIIRINGDYLIGETNSFERALRLKRILLKELSEYIAYERIDVKDISSIPPLDEKEKEKLEEEMKKIYSNPEIRNLLKQEMEDYYYKSWIRQKLPALGYQTPLQAVKTEEGKKRVEELLKLFEKFQESLPEDKFPKINFDKLRKKLGLI